MNRANVSKYNPKYLDDSRGEIVDIEFHEELYNTFNEYAKAVIISRALPGICDGLKLVQRRVIYSMYESNNTYDERHRKSARAMGEIVGKYHPHGDIATYETMVRLAQWWSMYVPMIDPQGNFGSIDGDGPAAYRYTELRLSKACSSLLCPPRPKVTTFVKNYDGTLNEPVSLNFKVPFTLINGNRGISVTLISSVPSHNTNEIIGACLYALSSDNFRDITLEEIRKFVKGPDFSVFCKIDDQNLDLIYQTGQGVLVTSVKMDILPEEHCIIIIGLPHNTKKIKLIQSIALAVQEKIINGINDIIDESTDDDFKIRVLCDKTANLTVIAKRLKKYTYCSNHEGIAMRFVVDKKTKVYSLTGLIVDFIQRRIEHIKHSLCVDNAEIMDQISKSIAMFVVTQTNSTLDMVKKIMESETPDQARILLSQMKFDASQIKQLLPPVMQKFHGSTIQLTKSQVEALLQTKLQSLSRQKTENIVQSIKSSSSKIAENERIINSESKIKAIIRDELNKALKIIGKERVCDIERLDHSIHIRDIEVEKDILIIVGDDNKFLYKDYQLLKPQRRGGRGKSTDIGKISVLSCTTCTSHDNLVIFTKMGFCYKFNVFDIVYGDKSLLDIINLRQNDAIVCTYRLSLSDRYNNIVMITKNGYIKKHNTEEFKFFNKSGKRIFSLEEDDCIRSIIYTNAESSIGIFTKKSKFIIINSTELREYTNRNTRGTKGIKLKTDDEVQAILEIEDKEQAILVVSESGIAKKFSISTNKTQKRNTTGSLCIKTEKYGQLASCMVISDSQRNVILVTNSGKLMVASSDEIPELHRTARGVKLIHLDGPDKVIFSCTV